MKSFLAISLGAILGANLRYLITLWAQRHWPMWPLGTFLVNVVGSFGLALLLTVATRRYPLTPELRLLLTTGFFGAFTTFSTFSVEVLLMAERHGMFALLYALASLLLALAAALAGSWVGHLVVH